MFLVISTLFASYAFTGQEKNRKDTQKDPTEFPKKQGHDPSAHVILDVTAVSGFPADALEPAVTSGEVEVCFCEDKEVSLAARGLGVVQEIGYVQRLCGSCRESSY